MSDIELVIKIPEKYIKTVQHRNPLSLSAISEVEKAIAVGTPLDKIRAEIEQLPTAKCTETRRIYIDADDFKENVLAIFDKYKAESEE